MGEALLKAESYSLEDWLALESDRESNMDGIRYEYHFGEVFGMAGGYLDHSIISGNAHFLLKSHFKNSGRKCIAFNSQVKIEISPRGRYVYPATVAVCSDPEESTHVKGSITNPTVVIEVMSPSSEVYDLNKKFDYYSSLPSVREYLVIAQDEVKVILFRRRKDDTMWALGHYHGLDTEIELKSLGLTFLLRELYDDVVLKS